MTTSMDPQSVARDESNANTAASRKKAFDRYWSGNIRITLVLLSIWAAVGLGCGVLFADKLNEFKLGGYPVGFWFAQQGSIIVFVFLILTFCLVMNKRDDHRHTELEADESTGGGGI